MRRNRNFMLYPVSNANSSGNGFSKYRIFNSKQNKFVDNSQEPNTFSETSSTTDSAHSLINVVYDDYFKNILHSWTQLGNAFIPCIVLEDIEYCPAKLLEQLVFKNYLVKLSPKLYKKILPSFFLTQYETDIINDMVSSTDCGYNGQKLMYNDYFVKLEDAKAFYEFLLFCRDVLNSVEMHKPEKCGFLRFNKTALVPYILRDTNKLAPLLYFEGSIEKFEDQAVTLTTTEWIYMRMCFIIQGTREDLFDKNMKFISVDVLKTNPKSDIVFDEFWPKTSDQFLPLMVKLSESYEPLLWIENPVYEFSTVKKEPALEINYSKCNLLQYNEELSQLEYCSNFHSGVPSIGSMPSITSDSKSFYWTRVGNAFLPVIIKRDEKLCAAQYLEDFVYKDILNTLNPILYENALTSTMTTTTDIEILNGIINLHYKDYDKNILKPGDPLVTLTSAKSFYEFIMYCKKLQSLNLKDNLEKCGFIRINRKPLVPFIKREGKHFVPFMYFEGNLEEFHNLSVTATRKEWCYMKLCFVIQGTRVEILDKERKIIELDLLKNSFGKNFKFDEFWPKQKSDFMRVSAKRSNKYTPLKWCEPPGYFY